jgi:long-chain acyl-CoA synthetase
MIPDWTRGGTLFVTGATGLLGRASLARLLDADHSLRAVVLVRDLARWGAAAAALGALAERVTPVVGDLRAPGLGLDAARRATLAARTTAVLHLAADTVFSRPLAEARAANVAGTRRVLELASDCRGVGRFAFVSTAFVAGRLTGRIAEGDNGGAAGWVNAYERSKYEAEALVRASALDWVILRPSTVVCDGATGAVAQVNAVHRALRLYYHGLASMMPGADDSPVDVVPSDYVSDAIARLALREGLGGQTLHLCAGAGALSLGELLDVTYELWAASPSWRRRGIARPALTDLATYRLFERTVAETGDPTLRRVTRSLSHFVPQLALPKRFDTAGADAALGRAAPPVRAYWGMMIRSLLAGRWGTSPPEAAA